MSLLINIPDRNTDKLVAKLAERIGSENIEVWPDVAKPDDVELALVWQHEPGSLVPFKNLKAVSSFGAGVDSIFADSQLPNVPVTRIVDADLSENMAQYVLTIVNQYRLRLPTYQTQQSLALWKPRSNRKGRDVGILGLGKLGMHVGEVLIKNGYRVKGWSRTVKSHPSIDCMSGNVGFDSLIQNVDYLVCLLPLTTDTKGIINDEVFSKMKTDAVLINVARGGHVNEDSVIAALYNKEVAAAYLDVFDIEPLPESHPYWRTPNLHITPHVSAVTNVNTAVEQVIENYNNVLDGTELINVVDKTLGY